MAHDITASLSKLEFSEMFAYRQPVYINNYGLYHMMIVVNDKVKSMPKLRTFATLREESSQTNVILQYKLPAPILSAMCSVIQIQQS